LDITLSTPLPSALIRLATAFSGSDLDVVGLAGEVLDGLHREVGVDRGRAVADSRADVVHLADVAGLDQQPDLGAGLLADQVVVDRAGEQQRRDRRQVGGRVPVGEHDDPRAVGDRLADLGTDLVDRRRHRASAALDVVEPPHDVGREPGMSPSRLMCRIFARSSLEKTGNGSTTWRHDAGCGSSRLASGPDPSPTAR
jgi:hypothetical protein